MPENLSAFERENHLGLLGIEERVVAAGGRLEVLSAPGEGATIVCRLPRRRKDTR